MIRRLRSLRSAWRALRRYLDGAWALIAVVAVTALLSGFAEAGVLYVVVQAGLALASGDRRVTIDLPVLPEHVFAFGTVLLIALGALAVVVLLALVQSLAIASISTSTVNLARKRTFEAFVNASWPVQMGQPEGHLQQLLTAFVGRVGMWSLRLSGAIAAALCLLAYLASAFLIEPVVALAVFVGLGLVSAVLVPMSRLSKRLSRASARLSRDYATLLSQSVRTTREIRLFDVEGTVLEQVERKADRAERLAFRSRLVGQVTPKAFQYAALALVIGGLALIETTSEGELTEIGAVILLLIRSLSYGQQLSTNVQGLFDNEPYVSTVVEAHTTFDRGRAPRGDRDLSAPSSLRLAEVSFSYERGTPVLQGIDLEIEAGEAVGIVGPSGGGKSTLAHVILRLLTPDSGSYLVDGVDAASVSPESWARALAFVPQDNLLFQGSIADNIKFFRDSITDEMVAEAATMARLMSDVAAMPDGLATQVGTGVRDLSGGQRQRLGIARALVGRPAVLLMDEPTSALDMESEELIRQTLQDLRATTTLIIIAHRPSTLSLCDRIVVLDGGVIVADGPPTDVVQRNEYFERSLSFAQGGGRRRVP